MSTPDLPLRMKQLKLHGMASQWPELLAKAQLHAMAPEHWMVELLQAESAERHVRAQANQMKAARFPVHRDLLGFEFSGCPVDRALVERLHEGHFIQTAENVVLVGGPGTGKTHLATAIGIQTVRQHRLRVRFFSTIELVNALEKEQAQGKAGQIALRLAHADLHILETGNDSWRFRNSSAATRNRARSRAKEGTAQTDN